jgi:molybdopterin synthase sulfur carrier subunit
MMVKVRAFARFREVIGDETVVEVPEGSTITGVLECLCDGNDEVQNLIFDADGAVRGYVILLKNRQRIPLSAAAEERVRDGDELVLFPPVAGG